MLVVQFTHFFLPLWNSVEVQFGKQWVLHPVWFCMSMYFKFPRALDIPGLFWCYGSCHSLLISIAFMEGFLLYKPHFLFFMTVPTFLTYWYSDKWNTIADFNGLFRNIKKNLTESYFGIGFKRFVTLIIFSPLYYHLVWSFSRPESWVAH